MCYPETFGLPAKGFGFRVQGFGFKVQGSGFRVQGSGFRVQGSGGLPVAVNVVSLFVCAGRQAKVVQTCREKIKNNFMHFFILFIEIYFGSFRRGGLSRMEFFPNYCRL
jgi:hypothetical protein